MSYNCFWALNPTPPLDFVYKDKKPVAPYICPLQLVDQDIECNELIHELEQRRLLTVRKHGRQNFQRVINHFKTNVSIWMVHEKKVKLTSKNLEKAVALGKLGWKSTFIWTSG